MSVCASYLTQNRKLSQNDFTLITAIVPVKKGADKNGLGVLTKYCPLLSLSILQEVC